MPRRIGREPGYAMAALLVAMSVMAIMLSVALPVWNTAVKREREAELVFRGEQYAHAIQLFSRSTGGYPTSLDQLVEGRFLRKRYTDPMTDGDFQPLYLGQPLPGQTTPPAQASGGAAGARPLGQPLGQPLTTTPPGGRAEQPGVGGGPIVGVISRSTAESLRLYNDLDHYNQWAFVATEATTQPGAAGGTQTPTVPGGPAGQVPGVPVPGRGGRGGARGRGRPAQDQQPPGGAGGVRGRGGPASLPFPGGRFQGPGTPR